MSRMYTTTGWGKTAKGGKFEKLSFKRNKGGEFDITFREAI